MSDLLHVVALSASVADLDALERLLAGFPGDSGLTFIVLHSPKDADEERDLAELLRPSTSLRVVQLSGAEELKGDSVFVVPPGVDADFRDRHLVTRSEGDEVRAPRSEFLRALAEAQGRRCVGILLSDQRAEGMAILQHIKEWGGLSIALESADASADGDAQAAVDLVLRLDEIPDAILSSIETEPLLDAHPHRYPSARIRVFLQKVFARVRAHTGRDFSYYKRSTMIRRISRRMQFLLLKRPEAYLEVLRESPEEVAALADDLLITVTDFFRDPDVFEALASTTIPALFDAAPAEGIRVWSLGCASGEEAYSLAMLLLEEAGRRDTSPSLQVFATDLHEKCLQRAREGVYSEEIEARVSPDRLKRFFVRENGGYRIRKELRELVLFAPHNLLGDPPFSRLDLISCRNLLIYLSRDLHRQLTEIFHYALRPSRTLVLGSSESIDGHDLFLADDKKLGIYRRRDVAGPEPRLSMFPLMQRHRSAGLEPQGASKALSYDRLHQRIITQHAPPSLLVGPEDNVLHVSGAAGHYLVQPAGHITSSVFKLLREELRIELHTGLSQARRKRLPVVTPATLVRFNGSSELVSLCIQPALSAEQDGFVSVQFERRPRSKETADSEALESEAPNVKEIYEAKRILEERLRQSIEERETSQEELKASNEELQSANEELRSTLEELETSKEELQSINEELQTVNQENRHKVEDLAQLSNDLQNLLVATDIGTLFLDRDLRILRFTPKLEELFNVRSTDRGRPITDFTSKLGYDQLGNDVRLVLERLTPVEHEIRDRSGDWYLARVLPYRTSEDRIAGIVITFVNITQQKKAEESVRDAKRWAERIIEWLPQPLLVLNGDMSVRLANEAFYRTFEVGAEDTLGAPIHRLGNGQWDIPALQRLLREVLPENKSFADYLVEHHFPKIGHRVMLLNGSRLPEQDLILIGMQDITRRYEAERALRESEGRLNEENEHKDEYLAMLGHELRNPLGAVRSAVEILQLSRSQDPLQERACRVLDRQTAHMSRMIDGLLDVSRIARGKVHLETEPLSLRELLRRVLEARGAECAKRGVSCRSELTSEQDTVMGDLARLMQVFDNLVGNAVKFTDPPGEVVVALVREGSYAVVRVRDSGTGIRAEMLPRVFDAFWQDSQDAARTAGGLGLGLPLARGLVELHGGTIAAHSEGPGTGSEFEVRLPLADEKPSAPAPAPRAATSTRRILIVEDHADAAEMLRALLEADGHEVLHASDGSQALDLLRARGADMVLSDLGLPGMRGEELARIIRRDPALRETPLVALSGYGQPSDRERSREAGFDAHRVKPIDAETLRALVLELGGEIK